MTSKGSPLRRLGKVKERNGSMAGRLAYVIGAAVAAIGAAMLIAVAFALIYQ